MSRLSRLLTTLIIVGLLGSLGGLVRAETSSDSPLLNGLSQILHDPNKQMAMTPDRSAVVFMSKQGEVSFGADCQMRLHAPGTLQRMADLSKGFSVNLGEALGHRGSKDPDAIGCLVKLAQDQGLNWRLRPNEMGFNGKAYSATNRPLDIWSSSTKLTVAPSGACTIQQTRRGPLGFGTTAARRTVDSTSVVKPPATSRLIVAPRRPGSLSAGPACRTGVKPLAGGAYLRTRTRTR